MNFGKTESLDTPKSVGEKKMRRGEGGRGLRPKMAHQGKMAGVKPKFFLKNSKKRFALFEKFEKKGCRIQK